MSWSRRARGWQWQPAAVAPLKLTDGGRESCCRAGPLAVLCLPILKKPIHPSLMKPEPERTNGLAELHLHLHRNDNDNEPEHATSLLVRFAAWKAAVLELVRLTLHQELGALRLLRRRDRESETARPMASSHLAALVSLLLPCLLAVLLLRLAAVLDPDPDAAVPRVKAAAPLPLRFRHDGAFKILQVADMHFGNGAATRCRDVGPDGGGALCSDLNTTRFLRRVIEAEKPDLIAFTGDNIFGGSATDAAESLLRAISPAIEYKVPWAAILGNHDQESTMTREELMTFMSLMDYSVSQVNPPGFLVHGFGNYHIGIHGPFGSELVNTSLLNLYFLDSGDREVVNGVKTYGWIKESQLAWLRATSLELQKKIHAPGLAFFHIPIPEVRGLWYSGFKGQYQEGVACSSVNSGVLGTLVSMGDVKAVFLGHDHLNDFCGNLNGIWFCYGGGFGYHAYGRPHWPRRARIIYSELKKGQRSWREVELIQTWKLLDDEKLSKIDEQVLWRHSTDDSDHSV